VFVEWWWGWKGSADGARLLLLVGHDGESSGWLGTLSGARVSVAPGYVSSSSLDDALTTVDPSYVAAMRVM